MQSIFAIVPSGRHDDDARINQFSNGATDGVVFVGIYSIRAETHVDDPDVVGVAVGEHCVQSA